MTPQGLYQFRVMPFGLTNAPLVFQRLMQRTLKGLNPEAGPDFVEVYVNYVFIFSQAPEEHLDHLAKVIERLQEVGLKLKPTKCQFIRQEVEYLGHVMTPEGLKPNTRLVQAVEEFPTPRNVKELGRFLGMSLDLSRSLRASPTPYIDSRGRRSISSGVMNVPVRSQC